MSILFKMCEKLFVKQEYWLRASLAGLIWPCHLSIHLPIYLSVCLSVYVCMYLILSIYLSTDGGKRGQGPSLLKKIWQGGRPPSTFNFMSTKNTLKTKIKAVRHHAPAYLRNVIKEYAPTRSLRSSSQKLLKVPYTPSTLVQDRAFSVVGPQLWNELPFNIRDEQSIDLFKSKLKTHLFTATYN